MTRLHYSGPTPRRPVGRERVTQDSREVKKVNKKDITLKQRHVFLFSAAVGVIY